VRDYELGQKVSVFDFQFQQFRMLTFSDIAFGENVPLYDAQQADSSEPDSSYIFFRTEEIKAKDVTLAVVKPQVVEAWKLNKAYELALKDAAAGRQGERRQVAQGRGQRQVEVLARLLRMTMAHGVRLWPAQPQPGRGSIWPATNSCGPCSRSLRGRRA
jgi:hypothetical protein